MSITLIGINHKTAPIEIREQFAFTENQLSDALLDLQAKLNLHGALILSTCNRIEIICSNTDSTSIINWLLSYRCVNWHGEFYCYQNEHAVEHAMKVASGIDSLVLGEPQILGQFKKAYHTSDQLNLIDTELRIACEHVFSATKTLRHKTAIGHCPISIAFSAVKLAQENIHDLSKRHVLLVGSGDTVALLCKHLSLLEIHSLTIINRTLTKAQQLAKQFNATALPLTALSDILPQSDIVISATDSTQPIIHSEMLMNHLNNRNTLMIDLGVPRNIDPAVAKLDGVILHCVDDIQSLITKNTLQRSHAAKQANEMINKFVTDYQHKLKVQATSDVICSMRNYAQVLRDEELNRSLKKLAQGLAPEVVLKEFAYALTNKLTHQPSINLKMASIKENTALLAAARQLFSVVE